MGATPLRAVLWHLLCTVGPRIRPIFAQVDERNAASRRVLEKCDFTLSTPPHDAQPLTTMLWYRWDPAQFAARLIAQAVSSPPTARIS